MVTIGNTVLPGVQVTVESSSSTGVGLGSPGLAVIIGGADMDVGEASENVVYAVTSASRARQLFGPSSSLTENVIDALGQNASPVYAVAVRGESQSESDLSSSSGTLAHAPISEDPEDTVFVVDSETKETIITMRDVAEETAESGEVYVNPVTGEYVLDESPIGSSDVTYYSQDYESAIEAVEEESNGRFDFIVALSENEDVTEAVFNATKRMEGNADFVIGICGIASHLDDVSAFENSYDTSRMQFIYPSRETDGSSILGRYAGLRSSLGIQSSPMRKTLNGVSGLNDTLSSEDLIHLVEQRVNPIARANGGARIIEDMTSVQESNMAEEQMAQGISRLVVDFVTVLVQRNADRFIGELHTIAARNALQNIIKSEMKNLMALSSIQGYTVSVQEVDAVTASVEVGVETTKPLRNIVATVAAGQVEQTE